MPIKTPFPSRPKRRYEPDYERDEFPVIRLRLPARELHAISARALLRNKALLQVLRERKRETGNPRAQLLAADIDMVKALSDAELERMTG